jgi:starch-binding outer membrane protein, SusD/RagB family
MKKLSSLILLFAFLVFTGCNKYLEKEPDNRAQLTDPQKVQLLLGTAYPQANYMAFTEAMSDNATDKGAGVISVTNADSYAWEDVKDNSQDSPEYYWNAAYEAIAASNQALDAILKAGNTQTYARQKGEALVTRAYSHFMLVTLFAKPYDPATAAANPGIPYVTEPETVVIKKYDRGTVASVYEMIEKDLIEGVPLISDDLYDVPKYHFNRSAANAFAARFYLYKRDYQKAVNYASVSVPNFLPNLRPWNTTYQTLGLNELPLQYQRTTQPANLLLVSAPSRYPYNFNYGTYRYALDPSLRPVILTNPVQVTGGSWSFMSGTLGQANIVVPKMHMRDFAYETPSSNFGLQYGTIPLFTVEEVLFNKAEANANLGKTAEAIADLNTYMSTRLTGVTPGSLPASMQITEAKVLAHYNNAFDIRTALVRLILEYKRAEYVQEGMRWFDILRHNIPVTHRFVGPGGQVIRTETLGPTDPRRQLKLPDAVKLSGITDLNR